MNGATQTFRRPSVATGTSHSRDGNQPMSASTPTSGTYIPPHLNSNYHSSTSRNGSGNNESRYTKEQLLGIYRSRRDSGILGGDVSDFFVADWNPHEEATMVNGSWGKRDDHKDSSLGPEVCWDHEGQFVPLGLLDMTDDEKEVRTSSPVIVSSLLRV
jgi:PERQ amino acid-rich with GYF domain-containing protein